MTDKKIKRSVGPRAQMAEEDDAAASRANVPPMLSQRQRDALVYTPQCRQQWGNRQVDGVTSLLKAQDIDEFLAKFAWLKETEVVRCRLQFVRCKREHRHSMSS